MFELDPRLREDTVAIGALPLCRVLLHHDARYPWVILVPERARVTEIHALSSEDRRALMDEVAAVSEAMASALGADKMNVAALGNIVPQLHVHVIARYHEDDAWPGPIWGKHPPLEYLADSRKTRLSLLRGAFAEIEGFSPA